MNHKLTTLSSDILNQLWWKWLEWEQQRLGNLTESEQYQLNRRIAYNERVRENNKADRFEKWLFQQGAEVRKRQGKKYLEFADEQQAMVFALKYS